MVTEEQIHQVIDQANDVANGEDGSHYPGMSYEEGIRDALNWVISGEENPMEE